ncbi:MAG: hypothetical protein M0C28_35390 [Candidatus Moduliflexus flocculans]|nr:hypothetical protein [Candidatus Moduliflexus flocculans]
MHTASMTTPRRAYLDNLKTVLVAGVITGARLHHLRRGRVLGLPRAFRRTRPSSSPPRSTWLVGSMFAMGLFFLIAGLLVAAGHGPQGPGGLPARPPRPARARLSWPSCSSSSPS